MNIIGITDNHDSGACLFIDGKLKFAVNEERLIREKQTRNFPVNSIQMCLDRIDKSNKTQFIFGSRFTPSILLRMFNKPYSKTYNNSQFNYLLNIYLLYQSAVKNNFISDVEEKLSKKFLKKYIKKLFNLKSVEVGFIDHHISHAYSAYSCSGFDNCLIITVDSMGDGITLSVNIGKNGAIRRIYDEPSSSAISLYYALHTENLGFRPIRDEGKVTGLASYGNPEQTKHIFNKILNYKGNGRLSKVNHIIPNIRGKGIFKSLETFKKEDIAAGLQKNMEDEFCKFVDFWINKTGIRNVCLAGGHFANVKLNQRIMNLKSVENIFVFPHMGDGGLAVGSVLAYLKKKPYPLKDVYLGPEYNDKNITTVLKKYCRSYEKMKKSGDEIATLLANGKVVLRYDGRMEFGPRALGNRSILYTPNNPDGLKEINKKLKRTGFMPFCPTILEDKLKMCFKDSKNIRHAGKFMVITLKCTEWMKQKCPGAVHVDGTSRPQILSRNDNPKYYDIINSFYNKTGLPCIINTSFNMHGEPIVCSPEDAIKSFKNSGLDYLAIGDYIVEQKELF